MVRSLTTRLAETLARTRAARGLSLDELATASGVSRATLSRLEKAEASPTAEMLDKLCFAYGYSLAQLMAKAEDGFAAHLPRADQSVWRDGDQGVVRRSVSPGGGGLAAEVLDCKLGAESTFDQDAPAVPGQEHHIYMLSGQMTVAVDDVVHQLDQGDSLRFRPHGRVRLATGLAAAKYILVTVTP